MRFFILFFLSFIFWSATAQIEITFPGERAVFQRDQNNEGFIPISGIVAEFATKIEARLLASSTALGTNTEWQVIDTTPNAGTFSGKIKGKGGWYRLEVRVFFGEIELGSTHLQRVGIGEVFVIAGQSNAQGFLRFNPPDSFDDRVNAYNLYSESTIPENSAIGNIVKLKKETNIGPHGQSAWCWGYLGDKLAEKFNVPILFFNVAYEGSTIENWYKSAIGESTVHLGFGFTFPDQTPYSFLRKILQNHVNVYGIRAILWHHGETDASENTNGDLYAERLRFIIEQSRKDTGKEIHWNVALVSRNVGRVNPNIIAAQQKVIAQVSNVSQGPISDDIQPNRIDLVHLSNVSGGEQGINLLGDAYFNVINNSILNSVKPFFGYSFEKLVLGCNADNLVKIERPRTYLSQVWNGNSNRNEPALVVDQGRYFLIGRDSTGNYFYSATTDVSKAYPTDRPIISALGGLTKCEGESITFNVDLSFYGVTWQDGSMGRNYTSTTNEEVKATYNNQYGCKTAFSNPLRTNFVPKPEPPEIVAPNGLDACNGQSVLLQIKEPKEGFTYTWNSGSVSNQLFVNNSSTVTAKAQSTIGCVSLPSAEKKVLILPIPSAPEIFQSGPYSLEIVNPENTFSNTQWFLEESFFYGGVNSLIVQSSGLYRAKSNFTFKETGRSCPTSFSGFFAYNRDESKSGLTVFPNPVRNNFFYIASDKEVETVSMTMYSSSGERVFSSIQKNVLPPRKIELKGNYTGKYYLKLEYGGFYRVFPLVFE